MDAVRRFLRTPIGWLAVQLTEVIVGVALWRWLVPDTGIGLVLLVLLLGGLGVFNLWLRRRFLPWDEPRDSPR